MPQHHDKDRDRSVTGKSPNTPSDHPEDRPAAGPHATAENTRETATPGAGALPEPSSRDVDPGAG